MRTGAGNRGDFRCMEAVFPITRIAGAGTCPAIRARSTSLPSTRLSFGIKAQESTLAGVSGSIPARTSPSAISPALLCPIMNTSVPLIPAKTE